MSEVCDSLYWLTRTCYSRSLPDTACHKTLIVFTSPVTRNWKLKRFPDTSISFHKVFNMEVYPTIILYCQCLITKREQGNNFHFIFILDKEKVMLWIEFSIFIYFYEKIFEWCSFMCFQFKWNATFKWLWRYGYTRICRASYRFLILEDEIRDRPRIGFERKWDILFKNFKLNIS